MKQVSTILLFILSLALTNGQTDINSKFTDASQLTIIGKAVTTPHLYHRIDTKLHDQLTASESQQARSSAGMALTFKTNSRYIKLLPKYTWEYKRDNMTGFASAGFDLYIKREGEWVYAASGTPADRNKEFYLINYMDDSEKECLLYLPIYSELESLQIGVESDADIEAIPNPFKSKIVFFGSSYTQGISASRPGMSYPMQVGRMLDVHVCNLGFSGNSRLQPYFANIIADVEADAFVFDAFSNPNADLIRDRLDSFMEVVGSKHKEVPLIFVETIYRGRNNFNLQSRQSEEDKMQAAAEMMEKILKKYPNVHFIKSPLPESMLGDTSADGVHPSDLGYYYWANYLAKKIEEILNFDEKSL